MASFREFPLGQVDETSTHEALNGTAHTAPSRRR
jgi:hypothetical protein